jgi:hypothetical protein
VTRDQLEHAIRAVCDVSGETEIIIIGSQSILGEYPDAPDALRQSTEIDVILRTKPEMTDRVEGALGELSQFHQTHDFYVHGVSHDTACLPTGWADRLVVVENEATRGRRGLCLQSYDLAASKLVAFRENDRDFVRTLLAEGLVLASELADQVNELPIAQSQRDRLAGWVIATGRTLAH